MTAVITKPSAITRHSEWMRVLRLMRTIVRRPVLPVLAAMLVEPGPQPDTIKVSGTDLEQSIVHVMPGGCEGRFLVPIHAAWDLMRSLSGGKSNKGIDVERVTVTAEGDLVTFRGFGRKLSTESFARTTLDDFPALPSIYGPLYAKVWAGTFLRAWKFAATAAGTDKVLPMLTGVKMEFDQGDAVRLAATDRYRLAVVDCPVQRKLSRRGGEALVPASVTQKLAQLDGQMAIRLAGKPGGGERVVFTTAWTSVVARTLDAAFPGYRSLMPSEVEGEVMFPREAVIGDVTAVMGSLDRGAPVRLTFSPTGVTVQGCPTRPVRWLDASVLGQTAYNPAFLLDALKSFDGNDVHLRLTTLQKPAVFTGELPNNIAGVHLVMPVRLPG